MREPVTKILRRALRLVEERCSEAHAEMVASLDGMAMAVTVAGEDGLVLRCDTDGLREWTGGGAGSHAGGCFGSCLFHGGLLACSLHGH